MQGYSNFRKGQKISASKNQRSEPWTLNEFYEAFEEDLLRIAHRQNWPGSGLEDDDLVQEFWIYCLGNWDKVGYWERPLVLTQARRFCVKLNRDARAEYLQSRGGWIYDREAVEQALWFSIWDPESRLPDLETQIDLSRAVATLPPKQWDAVYRHFAELEEFSSKSVDGRNLYRGMEAIVHFMNLNTVSGEVLIDDADAVVNMNGERVAEVDEWAM